MKSLIFKGLDLQGAPFKVTREEGLLNAPQRDVIAHELARSDNSVAVFRRYKARTFTLAGDIIAASEADLEAAIDALKLGLLAQIGELQVAWAGGYRYFTAECLNVIINRGRGDITRCGWSAQFFMATPFSTDNITRDFFTAVTGHTARSLSIGVNNIGTYLADPFITLTLTALEPNTTPVSITVSNPATSESITVTDEFADGDVVTIDVFNKQIFRGTELLAGSGNFPEWQPGAGLLQLSDNASSGTMNIAGTYKARFL